MREPDARVGKIGDLQACGGSIVGMLRRAVWVELIMLPSGSKTEMLGLAGCLLRLGAWMVMKWPVEPVSAMQVDVNIEKWVGVAMGDGEETGTLRATAAGSSRVMGDRRLGWFMSITENVRGGSVYPLSS
jgi:hypothetical protein